MFLHAAWRLSPCKSQPSWIKGTERDLYTSYKLCLPLLSSSTAWPWYNSITSRFRASFTRRQVVLQEWIPAMTWGALAPCTGKAKKQVILRPESGSQVPLVLQTAVSLLWLLAFRGGKPGCMYGQSHAYVSKLLHPFYKQLLVVFCLGRSSSLCSVLSLCLWWQSLFRAYSVLFSSVRMLAIQAVFAASWETVWVRKKSKLMGVIPMQASGHIPEGIFMMDAASLYLKGGQSMRRENQVQAGILSHLSLFSLSGYDEHHALEVPTAPYQLSRSLYSHGSLLLLAF